MSIKIVMTDGTFVADKIGGKVHTKESAEADAKDRNERAEKLGIKARYKVVGEVRE